MATTSAQVQQLYVAYLGRAADKAGLDYWLNELNGSTTAPASLTLENLRANFVNEQAEYQDAYAGLTRSETVSKIYLQLFGRPADAAGLEYWTNGAGASVNADQLLVAFVNGASAADAQVITNKVLVAEVYTSTAGANYVAADAKSVIA
ncbi:MAG: outer rane adhesin-like protein, partial [Pseudomonas sp.]|nr:outer rane adhesin-like protein [Pseudomonas sp.]